MNIARPLSDHESVKVMSDHLELCIKLFSVLVTLGAAVGSTILLIYLNSVGLGGEITAAIASPQILIPIALAFTLIFGVIFGSYIVIPQMLKKEFYSKIRSEKEKKPFADRLKVLGFSVTPPLLVGAAILQEFQTRYALMLFVASLVIGMIGITHTERTQSSKVVTSTLVGKILLVMLITFANALLLWEIGYRALAGVSGGGNWTYYLSLLLMLLPAGIVVGAMYDENVRNKCVVAVGVLLPILMCTGNVPKNIVKMFKIGNFQETLVVNKRGCRLLSRINDVACTKNEDGFYIFPDIHVKLRLSNKIIVASSSISSVSLSLSKSDVVGSFLCERVRGKKLEAKSPCYRGEETDSKSETPALNKDKERA